MKILIALFILAAFPEPQEWISLNDERFDFRYTGEMERTAKDLFLKSEAIHARISDFLGFEFDDKVAVVFAPDIESFLSMQGGNAPDWASGTAYPEKKIIFLRPLDAREVRGNNLGMIFAHELSHVMFYHRLNARHAPRWLEEGTAMLLSGEMLLRSADQLLGVGVTGRHITFRLLERSFPASGEEARLAYAQSADMVSFIRREFGNEAYFNLLDSLAAGDDLEAALEKSLGKGMADLEDEWLGSVRRRWGFLPLLTGSISLWFLISMLFIAAYIKKRRSSRERRQIMELEDRMDRLSYHSEDDDRQGYLH